MQTQSVSCKPEFGYSTDIGGSLVDVFDAVVLSHGIVLCSGRKFWPIKVRSYRSEDLLPKCRKSQICIP